MDTVIQDVMNWDITNWAFSDLNNIAYLVAAVAVLGALNGVRRSLSHCGRVARRRR